MAGIKVLIDMQVCRRLEAGDPHVHTHEYGNAMLKEDFAADSRWVILSSPRQGFDPDPLWICIFGVPGFEAMSYKSASNLKFLK